MESNKKHRHVEQWVTLTSYNSQTGPIGLGVPLGIWCDGGGTILGLSNAEIATKLDLSGRAVKAHLEEAVRKLRLVNHSIRD